MGPMKPSAVKESTEAVSHYKRKLSRNIEAADSADIVLHCLTKLQRIPVNISILQETGIGKVVNQLKKSAIGDERISSKAREIVQKWKDVVANEEEENGDDDDDEEEEDEEPEVAEPEVDHSDGGGSDEAVDSLDPPVLEPEKQVSKLVPKEQTSPKRSSKSSGSKSTSSSSKERASSSSSSKHRNESSSSSSSSKKKKKDKDREKDFEKKSHRDDEKNKKRKHSETEVDDSRKKRKEGEKDVSEKKDKHSSSSRDKDKHRSSSSKGSSTKSGQTIGFEAAMMAVEKKGSKSSKSSSSSSSSKAKSVVLPTNRPSANLHINGEKKKRTNLVPPTPPPLPPLFDVPCDISPNYTPLKHRPLPSEGPPRGNRMFSHITDGKTDDEALSALISMSKNAKRSAVYSGSKRSAFSDSVPSLFQLCIHVLQEHVDEIAECGGLPFDILEPVLDRAKPDALMTIEDYNPYLMEDTGSLWERICRKEFPKERREEFESWRELYERCTTARNEKLDFLTVRVQQSYKNAHTNHRKTKLAYVDEIAKPPRNIQRAQDRNGTGLIALSTRETIKSMGGPPRPRGEGRGPRGEGSAPFSSFKSKAKVAPMMAKTLKMVGGLKVNFRR